MNREQLYQIAENWFHNQNWKPFPFQTQTWTAFLQEKNGLLNAPTGSGKTYALWFPVVLNYIKENPDYKTKHKPGLKPFGLRHYAHFQSKLNKRQNELFRI